MDAIYNLIATLGVAIISLIGIFVQTKSKEKQDSISQKLDLLRKESKACDTVLNNKLDKNRIKTLRMWLITELTKIRDESYTPNEEQKRLIHEVKDEYNGLGGDSYVDDMFEDCKKKNLI